VTLKVADNGDPTLSTTNTFKVVVSETNTVPVFADIADRTIPELQAFTLNLSATDTDLPAQSLTYSLLVGPTGMTLSGNQLVWTPNGSQGSSTNTVLVKVSDNGNPVLSATNSFRLTVSEGNTPPVFTNFRDQNAPELQLFTFALAASDLDVPAQTLTYMLLAGPTGMTLSGNQLSWTPTEAQGPSTNEVNVKVTDNGDPTLSSTNTFKVVVTEVNTTPSFVGLRDHTIPELQPWTLTLVAGDSDLPAQSLTYALLAGPAGMTLTGDQLAWTPTEAQGPSTNEVTLKVADNGDPTLSTTNLFKVVVSEVNTAPVFAAIADRTIPELQPFALSLSATDADLPPQTLTYVLLTGPAGMTLSGNQLVWSPSALQGSSTNTVLVKVSDNGNPALSSTNVLRLVVSKGNTPPVFTNLRDQTVPELQMFTFALAASDLDLPAQTLTFALLVGPTGMSLNGNQLAWTPSEDQGPSTNAVKVKVTDNGDPSLSTTNIFKVVVGEVNTAPVFAAIADRTILELQPFALSLSVTDADLPPQTLTYVLLTGPAGMTLSGNQLAWTPSSSQGSSTNTVLVKVSDGGLPALSATNTFKLLVNKGTLLRIENPVYTGGSFKLEITIAKGTRYVVEWSENLETWSSLQEGVGSGERQSITDLAGAHTRRYYRILLLR
jgi:hypothetical protein